MIRALEPNSALRAVFKLFAEGIDTNRDFHTAPYRFPEGTSTETRAGVGAGLGTGGGEAFKDGPVTLVGKHGQQINSVGDIGFVIVNDGAFKDPDAAVSILRERLPDTVKVIKMSEEATHLVKPSDAPTAEPGSRQAIVRDAPYMTVEEIAATKQFRVEADGRVIRVTERQLSDSQRFDQRYQAVLKQIEAEQKNAARAATAAERERKLFIAEQNRNRALEVASEERFAAAARRKAQEEATRDARAAAQAQKLADQAQARADALKLQFERAYQAAEARATDKRVETNRLIELALASDQPLIAPGILMVDQARLPIKAERTVVVTDTVNKPSVTTRTNIVYLKNMAGFESQTQAFQKAFFNYMNADQISRGQAIAGEAFQGPMAAQQGINLLNTKVWVAENSGGRLLREYKKADRASNTATRLADITTYKVYGANGMLIKQTNDASDAIEAIETLERRFISTFKAPLGPLTAEGVGASMNAFATAYNTPPANRKSSAGAAFKEQQMGQIPGINKYLPMEPRR